MFAFTLRGIKAFQRDDRGAVAMIFGLTAIILVIFCGLAIDVGRAVHANTKITAAIDAAALAAAKGLRLQNLTVAQTKALATKMFEENMKSSGSSFAKINALTITVNPAKFAVEIQVDAVVPTTLGKIAGVNQIAIPKSAAAIFEAKDIEVAVQLDVTGSMCNPCSKISALKSATKTLVDTLIPDSGTGTQQVRIGFAPYSAGVNAGPYAYNIAGGVTAPGGCVYERQSTSYQSGDDYPSGMAALKTSDDLSSWAKPCPPAAQVLPMTSNKNLLKTTVDGYWTGGTTAGHLGTAFAYYLLSPNWSSIWPGSAKPAPFKDGKTIKVAILMTDGEYNTVNGIMNNGNKTVSADKAKATCSAMKADGILVYTVVFATTDTMALDTMEKCATSTANFYNAADAAALKKAFKDIAEDITKLRLSK